MTDEPFCYLLRVRYSECDAQKVVFNARYADYVDLAATEFMRSVWGNYNDLLAKGFDNQVVQLTLAWKAPARFDDVVAIQVKTASIGSSSYTLQFDFYLLDTHVHLASAQAVYVMVSAMEHKKMAIPDEMKLILERGAPGVITDHAGTDIPSDTKKRTP